MAKFSDLHEDIVLAILFNCEIPTILRLEQTSTFLKFVSESRQLWSTLVQDLDYNHAPNLLCHERIQTLATEKLRELVIRSHRGYLNWNSPQGPKATHSTVLEIPERLRHQESFNVLVPGGKFFVFYAADGFFHCYDIERSEKLCSYNRSFHDEEPISRVDCSLVEDGTVIVLGYIALRKSDGQIMINVVRFNLQSGASRIARSFLIPQTVLDGDHFPIMHEQQHHIKVNNTIIIIWIPGSFLVGNWRTGEVAIIEERGIVISMNLAQKHILCAIRPSSGGVVYAAAPLSLIFLAAKDLDSGGMDGGSPIRSEDVFLHVTRLVLPNINRGSFRPAVELVSVCSDSWKSKLLIEPDKRDISTRILLYLRLIPDNGDYFKYMMFELDFTSRSPLSSAESEYKLICRQQSPVYDYDVNSYGIRFSTASRTGRAIGRFPVPEGSSRHSHSRIVCPINMSDLLEGKERNLHIDDQPSFTVQRVEHSILINTLYSLNVEEYSGALWYHDGRTLYIDYFD